jgi:hypothetical protein
MTKRQEFGEAMLTGGATLLLYPLSWGIRKAFGLQDSEYITSFFFFYLAWVINDPHFAVTYLLFYRNWQTRAFSPTLPKVQRARWIFSGFIAPIALIFWGLWAIKVHNPQTLGAMVQLMYILVGWHYVKQGFGVLTVLSSRRGVKITPLERRVILAHCFIGWAFSWASPAAPASDFEEKGVIYTGLPHPKWLELGTGALLALSTTALLYVLIARKIREGRFLPIAPLAGLLISIWSWMIFSGWDPLVRYAIPGLHSLQYLYFVFLIRRNEARAQEGPPLFGRPVLIRLAFTALGALGLGAMLFHGIPEFLDLAFTKHLPPNELPDNMGTTPYFAALFTFVNLHHYFMDHVIWRRENPDTKYLQDAPAKPAAATTLEPERLAA